MSPREQLLELLNQDSDVVLVFTDADGTAEEVPAHSLILQQWSDVLAGALSTDHCSSINSRTQSRIPVNGTSKEDWLLAMEFIYPVVPRPEVTWDNAEALSQLGDKYCMPALMDKVSTFVRSHKSELQLKPGKLSVCRWIEMLDRYGLTAVAKECIDSQTDVSSLVDACPPDFPLSLSSGTMQHLFTAMKSWLPRRTGKAYCCYCRKVTDWIRYPERAKRTCCAACEATQCRKSYYSLAA